MAHDEGAEASKAYRILVVDDDPQIRRLLGILLGARWSVELAAGGEEGWAAVQRALPDLVISDVRMPGGGGMDFLRRLRSERATEAVPVILVSGHPDETFAGLAAGADDFLAKPFSSRELLVRVQSRLEITTMRRRAAQQQAQLESLQRHQRWVEQLLDTLPVPLVLLEPETEQILFANRAAARLAGAPLLRGSRLSDAGALQVSEEQAENEGRPLAQGRIAFSPCCPEVKARRVVWQTTSGPVSLLADSERLPSLDEQAPVVVLTLRDVTSLVREKSELRQTVRMRDEFLSVASHELRTPITTLSLDTEGLLRAHGQDTPSERTRRRLLSVRRQVARLEQLVDLLLDASRLLEGHLELRAEEMDLVAVAAESVELLHESADRAGSPISLHGDRSVVGRWDKLRVSQVMTNLLSNAIKFGCGGPIDIEATRTGRRARLRVSDRGIGIPPEGCARIFNRFERASSAGHFPGLGLGLWISKEIVDACGGAITVESRPGAGSTFTVELPGAS